MAKGSHDTPHLLLTAGVEGRIEVRDPTTGELRTRLGEHSSTVRELAVSPDGTTLASITTDGRTVQLWNLRTRTLLARLTGHRDVINSLDWSPDGRILASTGSPAAVTDLGCS